MQHRKNNFRTTGNEGHLWHQSGAIPPFHRRGGDSPKTCCLPYCNHCHWTQLMLGCCYGHNHKTLPWTRLLGPWVMQACKLVGSPNIISRFIFLHFCFLAHDIWGNRPNILEALLTKSRKKWWVVLRIHLSAARRDFMREGIGSVSQFVYFWSKVYSSCLSYNTLGMFTFRQKHHEISTVIQLIAGFMVRIAAHLCYKMWLIKG